MDEDQLAEWDGWLDSPFTADELQAEEDRRQALEDAEAEIEDRAPVELDLSEMPEHMRRWIEHQQAMQEARDADTRKRLGVGAHKELEERPGSDPGTS